MTSHHGHKNENKPNSFPWPARSYMVRSWLPLQTHFPGSCPSPMLCPYWPSPISRSFHWFLLTTLFPRPSHGCLLGVHFSTQTSSPLGGHFWSTLPRWSKHTTHSHSVTWPHFIFFIAFTGIWHVLTCLHAFSLCHPTGMSSLRTGTLSCSPFYPTASRTVIGTQVEMFSRLLGRRTGQEIWIWGL